MHRDVLIQEVASEYLRGDHKDPAPQVQCLSATYMFLKSAGGHTLFEHSPLCRRVAGGDVSGYLWHLKPQRFGERLLKLATKYQASTDGPWERTITTFLDVFRSSTSD